MELGCAEDYAPVTLELVRKRSVQDSVLHSVCIYFPEIERCLNTTLLHILLHVKSEAVAICEITYTDMSSRRRNTGDFSCSEVL